MQTNPKYTFVENICLMIMLYMMHILSDRGHVMGVYMNLNANVLGSHIGSIY